MISPIFRGMLCGRFSEGLMKRLELGQVDRRMFEKLIELTCSSIVDLSSVPEVIELARLADLYQMDTVSTALQDEAVELLNVETCAEMLTHSLDSGLQAIVNKCKRLALLEFEAISRTKGFESLGLEALRVLVEDNNLIVDNEESLLAHLLHWLENERHLERLRGVELFRFVRFPLMESRQLSKARQTLSKYPNVESLILEAMAVKSLAQEDQPDFEFRYLHPTSLKRRAKKSVDWSRQGCGAHILRVSRNANPIVHALHVVKGNVYGGCENGAIEVYSMEQYSLERSLLGHTSLVCALTSWNGWLISGSADKSIKVWDLEQFECVRTLHGHTWRVSSLAVCDSKLLSASWDSSIKIWKISVAECWKCERTLSGHEFSVHSIVVDGTKIMSGSTDNTIMVWDSVTGQCERTLTGHKDSVLALALCEKTLFSAAMDGTVMLWRTDSWQLLKTLYIYSSDEALYITCIAVHGTKLLCGSCGDDEHDQANSCDVFQTVG